MSNKDISYKKAIGELECILEQVESGELDMDELTTKVKKAAELIQYCRNKLLKTQDDVDKILEDLDE